MFKPISFCAALTAGAVSGSVWAEETPNTAVPTIQAFESLFGVTQGRRRNHTKGICFTGTLTPVDASLKTLSSSSLFQAPSQVIGRLSHKGGNAHAPDDQPHEYGMGLSMTTASGEQHLMAMNTLDFFPVATPEAFLALMQAKAGGKPALAEFKKRYPEITRFKAHMAARDNTLKPYEGMTFNSINSFYFNDKNGASTAVRWAFVPTGEQAIVVETSPDFYLNNLMQNQQKGVSWDMVVTIANPDDPINDPSKMWEGAHQTLIAARLSVDAVHSEAQGACEAINYDPLVLSKGVTPSNDPILQARRATYAISFGKRTVEKARQP